mmetsp:Transcript_32538/g.97083  ORF Transcript_32538/g.97083 Transcript_32538/m.97083 type:complete len:226 (-) Transcript_32538:112-789(-)
MRFSASSAVAVASAASRLQPGCRPTIQSTAAAPVNGAVTAAPPPTRASPPGEADMCAASARSSPPLAAESASAAASLAAAAAAACASSRSAGGSAGGDAALAVAWKLPSASEATRSSEPPMLLPPTKICGTVRLPVISRTLARSASSPETSTSAQVMPASVSASLARLQYGHARVDTIATGASASAVRLALVGVASVDCARVATPRACAGAAVRVIASCRRRGGA